MSHRLSGVTSVPRPQAQRSRDAIVQAVGELITEEGASGVTHARVAEKAGVGRATVYRHWPDPVDLLLAALTQAPLRFLEPANGTLVERTRDELHRIATELNAPNVVSMAATIVERAQWDPATKELRDGLVAHMLRNARAAIRGAVTSGELHAAPPADDLLVQLIGPLWSQRMLVGKPISRRLVERVLVDTLSPWLTDPSAVRTGE